jgi:hypothetical protein
MPVKINRWSVVIVAKKKMAVFWDVAPCSLTDVLEELLIVVA